MTQEKKEAGNNFIKNKKVLNYIVYFLDIAITTIILWFLAFAFYMDDTGALYFPIILSIGAPILYIYFVGNKYNSMRNFIIWSIIGICIILSWLFIFRDNQENALIDEGNILVSKIESFKNENGRLPESLGELGEVESEEGPLFYEKRANGDYVILFSTSFDDIKGYYSDVGKWEDVYR